MGHGTPNSRSALAVLVLSLLLALATLPVDGQGGEGPELEWDAEVRLSESSEISDDPTVALMPGGGMVVAWRERLVGRYQVFFAVLDATGRVVGERQQLGEDLPASMDPSVAADSRGRLHFVWTALEEQELWYARTSGAGVIEVGPQRLTEAQGDSAEASVWLDSRDHLHVVWFDGRQGTTWLYYMQLDADGDKVVEDTPLVEVRTEEESAIAMDSWGDLHIAWNAIAPPAQLQWNSELHYTKVDTSGQVLVRDRLVATSRGSMGFPDMDLCLNDHVHLVWNEGVGPRERVLYAELDRSGRTVVEPLEVAGAVSAAARDVSVAVDGNEGIHLVWSQGTFGATELHYQTLAPGGATIGEPLRLTEAAGESSEPSMGLSPRGEPRVVWSDSRSGNPEVYLKVSSYPQAVVDLAVYSGELAFEPTTVIAEEDADLLVRVHNHGDTDSGASRMETVVDDSWVRHTDVPTIPPGGEAILTVGLLVTEGEHTVTVTLLIDDGSTFNNQASRSFRAWTAGTLMADAGPDLETVAGDATYFDATGTVYLGDGLLSYEWDFGDGSGTDTGLYVEHVFGTPGTFTVTLLVSDGEVEDTDTCQATVLRRDEPPRAVIDPPGPFVVDRLTPLALSAALSTDDIDVEAFAWDLGDGTTSDRVQVSHMYTQSGVYVIELTVTDTRGQIDINKTTVEVRNLPPVAELVQVPRRIEEGERTTFRVEAHDPDGLVDVVGWDFDARDGITFEVMGEEVTHAFQRAGRYNVTCIVRDDDGGQTTLHVEVTVEEPGGTISIGPTETLFLVIVVLAAVVLGLAMLSRRGDDKEPSQTVINHTQVSEADRR